MPLLPSSLPPLLPQLAPVLPPAAGAAPGDLFEALFAAVLDGGAGVVADGPACEADAPSRGIARAPELAALFAAVAPASECDPEAPAATDQPPCEFRDRAALLNALAVAPIVFPAAPPDAPPAPRALELSVEPERAPDLDMLPSAACVAGRVPNAAGASQASGVPIAARRISVPASQPPADVAFPTPVAPAALLRRSHDGVVLSQSDAAAAAAGFSEAAQPSRGRIVLHATVHPAARTRLAPADSDAAPATEAFALRIRPAARSAAPSAAPAVSGPPRLPLAEPLRDVRVRPEVSGREDSRQPDPAPKEPRSRIPVENTDAGGSRGEERDPRDARPGESPSTPDKPAPAPAPHADRRELPDTPVSFAPAAASAPAAEPARTVKPPLETTPPAPPAEPAATRPAAGAAREIALRVDAESTVEVRLSDRAGEIHVSVRTPDAELARAMREDLGGLTGKLAQAGYDAAVPVHDSSSAGRQHEGRRDTGGQREPSPGGGSGQQDQHQQRHGQQEQPRDRRFAWQDSFAEYFSGRDAGTKDQ